LAQPGRPVKDRVVQRFATVLGRLHADPQRLFHPLLADVFLQRLRPQRDLEPAFIVSDLVGQKAIRHLGRSLIKWDGANRLISALPGEAASWVHVVGSPAPASAFALRSWEARTGRPATGPGV